MLAALALVAVASQAACGASNFANNPRPTSQIAIAAKVDANKVAVAPSDFGAGLVTFTVTNTSKSPIRFVISGPKPASTSAINPGDNRSFQAQLAPGKYRASASGQLNARPASFTVGPKRGSSKNTLLLP
jgi:hypothetical protein